MWRIEGSHAFERKLESMAPAKQFCRFTYSGSEKKMAALFLNAAHHNLCRASMLDQPVRAG
jgi:hypothetical protein